MEVVRHTLHNSSIAEVRSNDILIKTTEDGLDLMGNVYYQGFDKMILHEKNITPHFFDLKTGIAGEILQKFSTYRIRLALVGDFTTYSSNSLKDFMYESNKLGQVVFVGTTTEAIEALSKN